MPIFQIHHITKYEYDRPVKESTNEIKIFPYFNAEQEVLNHELIITDNPEVYVFNDYWENRVGDFTLVSAHKELVIESKLTVRTINKSQPVKDFNCAFSELSEEVNGSLFLLELATADDIKSANDVNKIIGSLQLNFTGVANAVQLCSEYIFNNFKYIKGITNIETTVDEILEYRSGVCQDFAHVLLHLLRTIGIPSRYVSGYICPNKNGMRGEGATHAWIEAYIPKYGWAGIDPTNNVWITDHHVKLAVGKQFADCTPVKGTFKGPARQKLSVYVSVGYEDGHIFKEQTDVNLHPFDGDDKDIPPPVDIVLAQEQQQQ